MEFIVTDYSYYLPFKDSTNNHYGITREHIKLKGSFIGMYESPNDQTRDLLREMKINSKNSSEEFNVYIATDEEINNLKQTEVSIKANTRMALRIIEDSLTLRGSIYLGEKSFNEVKSLISVIPNSNSYFNFETIVLGDKVKNKLPLEIDFLSNTSGIQMSFTVQNLQKK